jgi:hypothetical protein
VETIEEVSGEERWCAASLFAFLGKDVGQFTTLPGKDGAMSGEKVEESKKSEGGMVGVPDPEIGQAGTMLRVYEMAYTKTLNSLGLIVDGIVGSAAKGSASAARLLFEYCQCFVDGVLVKPEEALSITTLLCIEAKKMAEENAAEEDDES